MEVIHKLFVTLFVLNSLFTFQAKSSLFREYIGATFNNVKFSDVPINPTVDIHFILSFAMDYDTSTSPSPTNGNFNVFWDSGNLSPSEVSSIKSANANVRVALSLGGDSVHGVKAYFSPSSVDSWVSNAATSLTSIIQQYNLDGIDIDYEQFQSDPDTFAECIGQLISTLKQNGVISFASIAPFDNSEVQSYYMTLWSKYGGSIDYVNFQFYAYAADISVTQFMDYYQKQTSNYNGGKILVSFATNDAGGLKPYNGFFTACDQLKSQNQLNGIFVWSADNSLNDGFQYEKQSQDFLTM